MLKLRKGLQMQQDNHSGNGTQLVRHLMRRLKGHALEQVLALYNQHKEVYQHQQLKQQVAMKRKRNEQLDK